MHIKRQQHFQKIPPRLPVAPPSPPLPPLPFPLSLPSSPHAAHPPTHADHAILAFPRQAEPPFPSPSPAQRGHRTLAQVPALLFLSSPPRRTKGDLVFPRCRTIKKQTYETHLLRGDAQLRRERLLLGLVGVGVVAVLLEPGVEPVVHGLGQPRVLHLELLVQLHRAGVLLTQLVAHAAGEEGLAVGVGGERVRAGLRAGGHELQVQRVLPQVEQLQLGRVRRAAGVVPLLIRREREIKSKSRGKGNWGRRSYRYSTSGECYVAQPFFAPTEVSGRRKK